MPAKKKTTPDLDAAPTPARRRTPRAASHKPAPARAARKTAPARPVFHPAEHHAEIAREAYLLWLGRGVRHGHDQSDWLDAVEIVKARYTA